jgi:Xaa-Pro aminopeptidase
MFDSEFFAGNRSRLRQLFSGTAPIVITANGRLQRVSDEAFPFAQDSSFWYLTGIDEPDLVLVMDKGKEYLIVPDQTIVQEKFDGVISTEDLIRRSGIKEILGEKEGWKSLGSRLKKVRHVATLGANPKYLETFGMYTNPSRGVLIHRIKEINANLELLDIRQHVSRMRMIKQPGELLALQSAIDITLKTLKNVTRPSQLSKYAYEYEVEADITRGFRKSGASGHAFAPVVAGGVRACTMHNIDNNAKLASDEFLLMDIGAQVSHYAADITRTVALGDNMSRRAISVHVAVQEVHGYACSILKPGVNLREYEKQVEEFMGEKLRELGLIKIIDRDNVRQYFPHATSHFLGLDTHDAGDYERPLEAGVVMTVEPGIYIPEESIGVRIEDDVLITPEGIKILSNSLPVQLT